jgi:nitroimidazol reductase NimA-like FMN-containing flavoprotein (pyridoxamine 5'-phosphate oxidase superfamily)
MDRTELAATIEDYLTHHYGGTLATVREDGLPQASGISYVSDGLVLYFGMDPDSQKKKNVDRNPNVGVAIFKDYYHLEKIKAVHLAGRCERTDDPDEIARAGALFIQKFPALGEFHGMTEWAERVGPIPFYKITPKLFAYMDYQKFGFNQYRLLEV